MSDADIHSELKRLMDKYPIYKWAVAWASPSYRDMELLSKYEERIEKLIIGTHFYQTDPRFIKKFRNNDKVRYILQPSGVYHPKIYLFENNNRDWECIIGSPNFTNYAFRYNRETAVLISSKDIDAETAYSNIDSIIIDCWSKSKQIDEDGLKQYINARKTKQRSIEALSEQYDPKDIDVQPPLDLEIFDISFAQYYQKITTEGGNQDVHTLAARKIVLNFAQKQFQKTSFDEFSILARNRIAGLIKDKQADWKLFGSMARAIVFKAVILNNNQHISEALGKIPINGEVKKSDYENYILEYRKAFAQGKGVGIATVTRLLAMKRPDYFLCVDGKNKDALCKDFDIQKNITVDNYWDRVVEKVKQCAWWQAEKPKNPKELTAWKYRVALLDVLYYKP